MFHGHSRNRSKADYYSKHLFLRVLCHELIDDDHIPTSMLPTAPRTSSPEPMEPGNNSDFDDMPNVKSSRDTTGDTLVNRKRTNRASILPVNREDLKVSGVLGRSPPSTMLSDLTRAKAEAVGIGILWFATADKLLLRKLQNGNSDTMKQPFWRSKE